MGDESFDDVLAELKVTYPGVCRGLATRLYEAHKRDLDVKEAYFENELKELAEAVMYFIFADNIVHARGWEYSYTDVDGSVQNIEDDWDASKVRVYELICENILSTERMEQIGQEFKDHHKEA